MKSFSRKPIVFGPVKLEVLTDKSWSIMCSPDSASINLKELVKRRFDYRVKDVIQADNFGFMKYGRS